MKKAVVSIIAFLLVAMLESCVSPQATKLQRFASNKEISEDYYYKLLRDKIEDKILAGEEFKSAKLEVILAAVGYPQNAEFFIYRLVFFQDSVYMYETSKDKRFNEVNSYSKRVKLDSMARSIAEYFDSYKENHLQKHLSKEDVRRKTFVDLRAIVVRKGNSDNVLLFAVNGTEYSDVDDNLPDLRLQEILELMHRSYVRYFGDPDSR